MTQQTSKTSEQKGFFFGLQPKIIIGFTLVFSLVFAVAFYWFFTFAEDAALQKVQEDLRNTLDGAVQGMDVEAFATIGEQVLDFEHEAFPDRYQQFIPLPQYLNEEELSEIVFELDQDALANFDIEAYQTHVQWLADVHNVEPNAVIYSFVPGPVENQLIYMATNALLTEGPGGEDPGTVGVDYGFSVTASVDANFELGENFQALASPLPAFDFEGYEDAFGRWISGYQRIEDADGNVLGAIGVDFNLEYVDEVRQDILNSVLIAFIVAYATLFILVWLMARTLTRPIQHLTAAARDIGAGKYETVELDRYTANVRVRDEIYTLGAVISNMRDQVYKREQKLISQVRELKIEIDEVKAKEQVDEIVESDFFDHLQQRVKDMRKRDKEKRETGTHPSSDES